MYAHAGALAGCVHAWDARRAPFIGLDAAHRVVRTRENRNGLVYRILTGGVERQFADLRKAFEDLLAAEVAQIEEDAAVDAAAFGDLGPLGP